jgi:two-component system response regulator YesN
MQDRAVSPANDAAFTYYPRLLRVKQYLEASPGERVSLDTAARVACLERKYFSAFFRARVGIGFAQWQRALRIEQATQILRSRDESVTCVAFSTGFHSLRTFERTFKRVVGLTPIAFKLSTRPQSR